MLENLAVEGRTLQREVFGGFFFLFHFAILQCVLLSGVNITFYGFLLHCFTPSGSTQVNFVTL